MCCILQSTALLCRNSSRESYFNFPKIENLAKHWVHWYSWLCCIICTLSIFTQVQLLEPAHDLVMAGEAGPRSLPCSLWPVWSGGWRWCGDLSQWCSCAGVIRSTVQPSVTTAPAAGLSPLDKLGWAGPGLASSSPADGGSSSCAEADSWQLGSCR